MNLMAIMDFISKLFGIDTPSDSGSVQAPVSEESVAPAVEAPVMETSVPESPAMETPAPEVPVMETPQPVASAEVAESVPEDTSPVEEPPAAPESNQTY
jgi:hypothetical protein